MTLKEMIENSRKCLVAEALLLTLNATRLTLLIVEIIETMISAVMMTMNLNLSTSLREDITMINLESPEEDDLKEEEVEEALMVAVIDRIDIREAMTTETETIEVQDSMIEIMVDQEEEEVTLEVETPETSAVGMIEEKIASMEEEIQILTKMIEEAEAISEGKIEI